MLFLRIMVNSFIIARIEVSQGGGLTQCMLGYHLSRPPPSRADTSPPRSRPTHPQSRQLPGDQAPPHPGPGTPLPRTRHPPGADPPPTDQAPPRAQSMLGDTSGRYASYWNAILLILFCSKLSAQYIFLLNRTFIVKLVVIK